jgi:hypothetical protein
MRFSRKRHGGVEAKLDRIEAGVLTSIVGDLLELLGDGEETGQDPLAALVGMPTGPVERPADPALARLLPDAYGDDDEAAAEFRRYTEADLRAGKRGSATVVLATLAPLLDRGGKVLLDREHQDAWLSCLNDLRLVLGTRLEVTEDTEFDPGSEDPRQQALHVYGWLGWLQESLLACMDPGAR